MIARLSLMLSGLLVASLGGCSSGSNAVVQPGTVLGEEGGEVQGASGIAVSIPPGALPTPTTVSLQTASGVDLPTLPGQFALLGVVNLSLGDVATTTAPLKLSMPMPSSVSASDWFFVAMVVSINGQTRLALADTVSANGGRLTTNSPPFPGVLSGGTYAFLDAGSESSLALFRTLGTDGIPIGGATVELVPTSNVTDTFASAFVGLSAQDGFVAVPTPIGATNVLATGISASQIGGVLGGSISVPLVPPITPPVLPAMWIDYMTNLILDDLGVEMNDIYSTTKPCGGPIEVHPNSIDHLPVGENVQLYVFQGGEDVTSSDSFTPANLANHIALSKGWDFHITSYQPLENGQPSSFVTVSDQGQLAAQEAGQGGVAVEVLFMCIRQTAGPFGISIPWITIPPPSATSVSPVVVEDLQKGLVIVNPSFEADSDWNFEDGACHSTYPTTGWTSTFGGGACGTWRLKPDGSLPIAGTPDGQNMAYCNVGSLSQTLSATLAVGVYTLRVSVGSRKDVPSPGYSIRLLSGGNVIAEDVNSVLPSPGMWSSSTLSYTSRPDDPYLGQTLSIVLATAGTQTDFDNVSLEFIPAQ